MINRVPGANRAPNIDKGTEQPGERQVTGMTLRCQEDIDKPGGLSFSAEWPRSSPKFKRTIKREWSSQETSEWLGRRWEFRVRLVVREIAE